MKKARLHPPLRKSVSPFSSLAASFVVTISASTGSAGCKKSLIDPPDDSRVTVSRRADGVCQMYRSMSCPKGASCNPPPPQEVDCPAELRDAGDSSPMITRRPPGKENWLRIPSHLWVGNEGCSFTPEQFCAPPGKPNAGECTPYPEATKVSCESPDAGGAQATTRKVDAFIYKDGVGSCHKVPAMECKRTPYGAMCDAVPDGDPTPCP